MAKDAKLDKGKKSKTPEPETKGKKAKGGNDEFAKPSEATGEGSNRWPINKGNLGKLMLITPLREQTVANTLGKPGETKAQIVADVIVFDEKKPEKSDVISDAEIEGGWVLGAIRSSINERRVLGRLNQDADKGKGDRPAWVLDDPTEADIKVAKAYLASVDPFEQKGAKGKAGKKSK